MPLAPTLTARLQSFDSGKLAPRVGSIILTDANEMSDHITAEVIDEAAAAGFDLVWIESPVKLETARLHYRGTLVEIAGDRDTARAKLRAVDTPCEVRALEPESDWPTLEELMRFAAASRFSTDRNISTAAFRQHKLALLRAHIENRQGVVAIAWSNDDTPRPVGYTCTSVSDDTAYIYDLAVDPEFRRGSVARALLRDNLERFAVTHPQVRNCMTRIYEDNVPCLNLLRSVGFVDTGRLFHYYHCWPKARR